MPATLTPPVVSALLSLDAVPKTTASVLDGFNSKPFSRNQWVVGDLITAIALLRQALMLVIRLFVYKTS